MKKLILFFLIGLIIGCNKDDNDSQSDSDPIVGSWNITNKSNNLSEIFIFNLDGTGEIIEEDSTPIRWSNDNENFDLTTQTYRIIELGERISFEVDFSSIFQSFTYTLTYISDPTKTRGGNGRKILTGSY